MAMPQIAIRLEDSELAVLDAQVKAGRAKSRSDAVRQSIAYLERRRQYREDAEILTSLRDQGQAPYPDLESIPAGDLFGFDQ